MARISGLEKKAGTLASALVLWRNAQNVRQRSHPGEAADARAGARLGRHRHGSWPRAETTSIPALHPVGESANSVPHRLPFLNRHQFCRGHKRGFER
jgi:hypothetical protein